MRVYNIQNDYEGKNAKKRDAREKDTVLRLNYETKLSLWSSSNFWRANRMLSFKAAVSVRILVR